MQGGYLVFFSAKLSTSWQIFKASARVLRSRKELAVFPILSGLTIFLTGFAMVLVAALLLPMGSDTLPPTFYPLIVVAYFVLAYIAIFWQAALISQANVALEGGDPSVAGGIGAAAQRGARLIPWTLISGVVSWVLSEIEDRVPFIGRLLDVAWRVISFQVLPTIVLEDLSTIETIKKTKDTLKRSWGDNVIGVVGLGLFSALLVLPGAALVYLGASLWTTVVTPVLLALGALLIVAAVVIGSALTGIFQTALYRFTVDGQVPGPFAGIDLNQALRTR
ncbi:DUF6159 family protein [Mycobacteroides immunogenum]|uniref:DUF6159 family protein n=1 Tax=Mycobacteroides immunogenum TaxID=83262 RepID=UPI0025B745AA|nr:DUF6159 family protein [Mycobacteroides immunogenum]WJR36457.1 DUF6159 family protein [Mycobacteroides immunogenum]